MEEDERLLRTVAPSNAGEGAHEHINAAPLPSALSFGHYSLSREGVRRLPPDAASLGSRPSIVLPHLGEHEKKFFDLVNGNELQLVSEFLDDSPHFNINCVNFQGVSALHVSVNNRSEQMVQLLLQRRGVQVGDCVLHAIRDNQIKITQLLLDKLNEISPGLEFVGCANSSDFPDHLTPLIFAAQCGHFEIIEMLIERGHVMSKPHAPNCACEECKSHVLEGDLLHGESMRLDLYRAFTSPAYISHTTDDPVLTAFELSKELKDYSNMLPEFKTPYRELAQEISDFAVELVGLCRSAEEMELMLKRDKGFDGPRDFSYPRLLSAMDYKQKKFVAHPHTQQMIQTAWLGEFREWKFKSTLTKLAYPFIRVALLPLVALLCLVMPGHGLVRLYSIPVNKMLTHNASYVAFLVLIFLESNTDKKEAKRGAPNTGLEIPIVLFVVARIWGSLRMCVIAGPARHFRRHWNSFDVAAYLLFAVTFGFWLVVASGDRGSDEANLERKYWHALDATLVAEGTFSLAVVMSFLRLLQFLILHFQLGPLQISLGKMSADVARYFTIFALVMVSFTCGSCRLYGYYDGMVQKDAITGVQTSQVSSFTDFSSALKTFFWAMFCMSDLSSADVVIETLPGEVEGTYVTNSHVFTEAVGHIIFALFEVLIVVMLLNMLVASVCSTFQRITDNVDVEWTYEKSVVYTEYMMQTTLPPPFNLLPTANGVATMVEWLQVMSGNVLGKKVRFTLANCCLVDVEPSKDMLRHFPILMTQIIQRYFREKDISVNNEIDEIETIKQELAEIKILAKATFAEKTQVSPNQ